MKEDQERQILLSVIVPVYNDEQYIKRCLDSIVKQASHDIEIIIVDNCSTDSTKKLCQEYVKNYLFVNLINCNTKGLVAARQSGLNVAKGKYVAWIDSDDTVSGYYIEQITKAINKNHDVDCVLFDYKLEFKNQNDVIYASRKTASLNYGYHNREYLKKSLYPYMFFRTARYFMVQSAWTKVFKKEILLKHHCVNNNITNFEDTAFTYECLYACKNLVYLNQALYVYNKHNASSMTSNLYDNWTEAINYCLSRFDGHQIICQIKSYFLRLLASDIEAKLKDKWSCEQINECLYNDKHIKNIISNTKQKEPLNLKTKFIYSFISENEYMKLIKVIKLRNRLLVK